ncbi:MAG TPA: FMN-binding negative transcriptional regulator [Stellaceae bacterium]|jgi:transcriptional regulator
MVYLPPVFTEARPEVLIAHIERYDFGLLVSHGPAGLMASHIPFLIERSRAESGAEELHLLGHLARPNPQVAEFADGGEVLAIFSGPHAYVSPGWYASRPAVPTWNYVDVHAYGALRLVEDDEWLRRFLHKLSARHEAGRAAPWRIADQPAAYIAGMIKGIIGLDIAVTRLEGKYKLSQNRPTADRPRIVAALEAEGRADALALARVMAEREPGLA